MMAVFTPDRAERLAAALQRQPGHEVVRLLNQQRVIATRQLGDLLLEARVYAEVWKGSTLYLRISYETIAERSVSL